MVQMEYNTYRPLALPGLVADLQLSNVINRTNRDVKNLGFGKGVFWVGSDGAKLPTASSKLESFVGVTVRTYTHATKDGDVEGYPPLYEANVMNWGVIWVTALEAVAVNDKAFVRLGTTSPGDFCKTAGSGVTLSLNLPNAKFVSAGGVGELVKLAIGVGVST